MRERARAWLQRVIAWPCCGLLRAGWLGRRAAGQAAHRIECDHLIRPGASPVHHFRGVVGLPGGSTSRRLPASGHLAGGAAPACPARQRARGPAALPIRDKMTSACRMPVQRGAGNSIRSGGSTAISGPIARGPVTVLSARRWCMRVGTCAGTPEGSSTGGEAEGAAEGPGSLRVGPVAAGISPGISTAAARSAATPAPRRGASEPTR